MDSVWFFYIFHMLIVFKDGLNAKYQKSIAKKGVLEKSYDEYKIAFF